MSSFHLLLEGRFAVKLEPGTRLPGSPRLPAGHPNPTVYSVAGGAPIKGRGRRRAPKSGSAYLAGRLYTVVGGRGLKKVQLLRAMRAWVARGPNRPAGTASGYAPPQ